MDIPKSAEIPQAVRLRQSKGNTVETSKNTTGGTLTTKQRQSNTNETLKIGLKINKITVFY